MSDRSDGGGPSLSCLELFSGVPAAIVTHIEKKCTWRRFEANQVVIKNGSHRPHGVFFLVEGVVEILKRGPRNDCISLADLHAPGCFGEFGAVSDEMGSATVRTVTSCIVAEIPSEEFLRLLNACPAASLYLLRKVVSLIKNLGEESVLHHSAHRALETAHRKAVLRSL